jgi:hypothetical protein
MSARYRRGWRSLLMVRFTSSRAAFAGYVSSTSGVAEIPDDLSRRTTRQPWTRSDITGFI